jgi:hypothetical protein
MLTAGILVTPVALLVVVLVAWRGAAFQNGRTSRVVSETDVEPKDRHDLVPELEETLKGYGPGPRSTHKHVTRYLPEAPAPPALLGTVELIFEGTPQFRARVGRTRLQLVRGLARSRAEHPAGRGDAGMVRRHALGRFSLLRREGQRVDNLKVERGPTVEH